MKCVFVCVCGCVVCHVTIHEVFGCLLFLIGDSLGTKLSNGEKGVYS